MTAIATEDLLDHFDLGDPARLRLSPEQVATDPTVYMLSIGVILR